MSLRSLHAGASLRPWDVRPFPRVGPSLLSPRAPALPPAGPLIQGQSCRVSAFALGRGVRAVALCPSCSRTSFSFRRSAPTDSNTCVGSRVCAVSLRRQRPAFQLCLVPLSCAVVPLTVLSTFQLSLIAFSIRAVTRLLDLVKVAATFAI